jgi:hypothetical protein
MISMPVVHSAQTVHLSCAEIKNYLQKDRNERSLDPRHLGGQSDVSKMVSDPMVCSTQTVQQSCVEIDTILK